MDSPIKVFLAEPQSLLREALGVMLSADSSLELVGQCGEGLKVIPEVARCMPDVLVAGIYLPGMNGLDVCRELARSGSPVATLILSADKDEAMISQALSVGAAGYLAKDCSRAVLLEAIRTVACGQVYLGPLVRRDVLQRAVQGRGDAYSRLTSRERQVLQAIAEGKSNAEIAQSLELSVKTVETHRAHVMRKLDMHDELSLFKFALRRGLVQLH